LLCIRARLLALFGATLTVTAIILANPLAAYILVLLGLAVVTASFATTLTAAIVVASTLVAITVTTATFTALKIGGCINISRSANRCWHYFCCINRHWRKRRRGDQCHQDKFFHGLSPWQMHHASALTSLLPESI